MFDARHEHSHGGYPGVLADNPRSQMAITEEEARRVVLYPLLLGALERASATIEDVRSNFSEACEMYANDHAIVEAALQLCRRS